MSNVINWRPREGESSLYKDRAISTVEAGGAWPYVERRRGPRRRDDFNRRSDDDAAATSPPADDRRAGTGQSFSSSAPVVSSAPLASVTPVAAVPPGVGDLSLLTGSERGWHNDPGEQSWRTADVPERARRGNASERHLRGYRNAVYAVDIAAAAIGALSAYAVRFGAGPNGQNSRYFWGVAVLPALWLTVVALCRAYEPRFLASSAEEYRRVMTAGLVLIAAISVVSYASKAEFARGYVVTAFPLCVLIAMSGRLVARRFLRKARLKGRCMQNVLVAGHEWSILDLVLELRRHPGSGLNVVGACVPGGRGSRRLVEAGVPVVGDLRDVVGAVTRLQVEVLAVTTCVEFGGPELRQVCWALENMDVDVVVAPGLIEVAGPRLHIRPVAGLPLLHVEKPEFAGVRRLVKSMFDRIFAGSLLLAFLPLMLIIAVLVRLTSPGPALFKQTRVGARGVKFKMLKFRSMHVDAEARLAAVRDQNDNADGLLFKIRDDPRVTRIGRLLRRYSLDELPQLINVVRGDMSLVGPRPPLPSEVALYPDDVRRRLLVKPGITGLWQVSGRSDLSWEESVRLDLRYVENWSLLYDFAILWQTAFAVVRGSGAY